ncbi:MAG: hypothetical protein ARM1_0031 [Candidatus Micrarchaeota archaeon]|nr:MAG: hypothetical protein ARM1_0031 [Candidatus Micrarchaeota archaeon]
MLTNKSFRLQSAMEYLMTYGWAFLIIAVVLIALVLLGVFNPGTFTGNSCIVTSQFLCSGLTPTTTSILITSFAQNTGSTWYAPTFFLTPMQNFTYYENIEGYPMYNLSYLQDDNLTSIVLAIKISNATTQAYYFAPAGTAVSAYLWVAYSLNYTADHKGECIKLSPIYEINSTCSIAPIACSPNTGCSKPTCKQIGTAYAVNTSCILIQVGRITYKSVG